MKKITVLSLIVAFIIGSCARNKPVETTKLGMGTDYYAVPLTLKGKVKEMKELNYRTSEKDGKIIKGELLTKKDLDSIGSTPNLAAYFDDKGMLTKYDQLDGEKVTASNILTVENGKWTRVEFKMKDSTTTYFVPQYDNSGYFVGGSSYRPLVDTLTSKIVLYHDTKGNYMKIEYYDYKNQMTGNHVGKFDEKGNCVELKYFNKDDSLMSTMTNTYDDNGYWIKSQVINEKPKSTSIWEFKNSKLDEKGNIVELYTNIDNGKFRMFTQRSYIYY
jgi:hypothetical protein